jgi:hypothetical protein
LSKVNYFNNFFNNMVQQQHSLTDRTGTQTRGSGSVVAPSQSIQYGKEQLRWRKPRDSWWKCNVDASIAHSSSSIGWCMRNCVGNFVAAGTISYPHILTAAEGEAMAILEAMREAISRGWTNIVFESDSKIAVDAIQANNHGILELCSIIL